MTRFRTLGALLGAAALIATAGCSSGNPSPPPAPAFMSLQQIADAIPCEKVLDVEASTAPNGLVTEKVCTMATGDDGYTLFEFTDTTSRDRIVAEPNPDVDGGSYLIIDKFAVAGVTDDIIALHGKLGTGEVRDAPPADLGGDIDCSTANQEDYDKFCAGTEDAPPEPEKVALGKTVDDGASDQVTVDGPAKCGLSKIDNVVPNDDWDYEDEDDQYLALRPAKGDMFCIVKAKWKNVGKAPTQAAEFGTLVTGNGVEYSGDDLDSYTSAYDDDACYATTLNPGKSCTLYGFYSLPKGAKPAAVNWGGPTEAGAPALYQLAVR
jgi:hypothetical protein